MDHGISIVHRHEIKFELCFALISHNTRYIVVSVSRLYTSLNPFEEFVHTCVPGFWCHRPLDEIDGPKRPVQLSGHFCSNRPQSHFIASSVAIVAKMLSSLLPACLSSFSVEKAAVSFEKGRSRHSHVMSTKLFQFHGQEHLLIDIL
jgi:hypothetical protein